MRGFAVACVSYVALFAYLTPTVDFLDIFGCEVEVKGSAISCVCITVSTEIVVAIVVGIVFRACSCYVRFCKGCFVTSGAGLDVSSVAVISSACEAVNIVSAGRLGDLGKDESSAVVGLYP